MLRRRLVEVGRPLTTALTDGPARDGTSARRTTSEGTIYPLLIRLRRAELVTTTWQESESGPPRRYYRLTEAGQAALDSFVKDWARFRDGVDAILMGREGK